MEEITNTAVEQEQTSDSFMEGWDDEPAADAADQPEEATEEMTPAAEPENQSETATDTEAETTAQEQADTSGQTQQQETPPADAPKVWTLRHMDEVKQVGEADMVILAQKGMDYDRIREKYEESKPVMELFGGFAKQAGMSVQDYVARIRFQAKQAQGLSEAEAKRSIDLEDREAAVSAKEAEEAQRQQAAAQALQAQNTADARRRADVAEFQKTFPDAAKDPKSIPAEVWADVRNGSTLVAAYAKYTVAQAKAAQQAAEQRAESTAQNQKNAVRSTGSMKSAGENLNSKDPFLEGWGD